MLNYNEIEKEINTLCKDNNIPLFFHKYIFITTIGMIKKYGIEYKELIINCIKETKFIFGIENIEKKVNEELLSQVEENLKNNSSAFVLYEIKVKKNNKIPEIYINYYLCIKNYNHTELENLEFIIHEINHIVCSKINTFFLCQDNSIGYRNGLFTKLLKKDEIGEGRAFDETINSLITDEIIKLIFSLKEETNNKTIIDFINSIPIEQLENYEVSGYKNLTTLFKKLYEIEDFNKLITSNLINGNIEAIQEEIDKYLGDKEYSKMLLKLDALLDTIYSQEQNIKKITEIYNQIRENFINKYIEKKYGKSLITG